MGKILIAIPTFENIMLETFKSIYDLNDCGHELTFEFIKGYDCARARNDIVNKANGYNIFVDTRARCGHATRYFQFE